MCGICGVIDPAGAAIDAGGVRAMLDALTHRGPDSWGMIEAPGVTAGIRRLRVIDLTTGDQPIRNEDGLVEVVFNGEIYNHAALRRELSAKGHRFTTRLRHGGTRPSLGRPRPRDGARARRDVRVLHRRSGTARDVRRPRRAGDQAACTCGAIRGRIVFASEMAALLRYPAPRPRIDPVRLVDLVALQYVPGAKTVFREVIEAPPGACDPRARGASRRTLPLVRVPGGFAGGGAATRRPRDDAAGPLAGTRCGRKRSPTSRSACSCPAGSTPPESRRCSPRRPRVACSRSPSDSRGAADARRAPIRQPREPRARHGASRAGRSRGRRRARCSRRRLPISRSRSSIPRCSPPGCLCAFRPHRRHGRALGRGADELFGGYRRHLFQQRLGWMRALPGLAPLARAGRRLGVVPTRVGRALEALGTRDPVRNHLEWSQTIARSLAAALFDDDLVREFARDADARFRPYFETERRRALRAPARRPLRVAAAQPAAEGRPRVDGVFARGSRSVPRASGRALRRRAPRRRSRSTAARRSGFSAARSPGSFPRRSLRRPKQGFDLPLAVVAPGTAARSRGDAPRRARARALARLEGEGGRGAVRPSSFRGAQELRAAAVQPAFDQPVPRSPWRLGARRSSTSSRDSSWEARNRTRLYCVEHHDRGRFEVGLLGRRGRDPGRERPGDRAGGRADPPVARPSDRARAGCRRRRRAWPRCSATWTSSTRTRRRPGILGRVAARARGRSRGRSHRPRLELQRCPAGADASPLPGGRARGGPPRPTGSSASPGRDR